MSRFIIAFCLLSLSLCSVGCRICSTPYDCHVSAYIDRCDDYRGNNPLYRAGSISGIWCGTHQMVDHAYLDGAYYEGESVDYYTNAGNYGVTTPVSLVSQTPSTDTGGFEIRQNTGQNLIAIPERAPGNTGLTVPNTTDSNRGIPTFEDLIKQRGTAPLPPPLVPPTRPGTAPSLEGTPSDSIPFSPNDALPNGVLPGDEVITPPSTFPSIMETDPPITLEELRRLDPTIQDVQIISIEDAAPGSLLR